MEKHNAPGEDELSFMAHRMLAALRRLRDRHGDMTILQAMCFLRIAQEQGINQRELYSDLGMADSSASRILALLSDIGGRNKIGLDLISLETDKKNRRQHILKLTSKGKRLLDDIYHEIEARPER
jgi:DNA-binding MarR family transcriptional regulator